MIRRDSRVSRPIHVLVTGELLRHRATGLEHYVRQLVPALRGRADVRVTLLVEDERRARESVGDVPMVAHRPPAWAVRSVLGRGLWYGASRAGFVPQYDLIHFPNVIPPFLRLPRGPRYVMTVHDLIPFAVPEDQTRLGRLYFQYVLPRLVRRIHYFLTPSEQTKADLERYLNVPADRIAVTPLASRFPLAPPHPTPREDFLLSVGSLSPRKNTAGLIEAFTLFKSRRADARTRLVLTGLPLVTCPPQLRERLAVTPDVEYLGYVSDDTLLSLYRRARGFVLPSFYEGFGLPPLEAMSQGCPVAVSNRTSLPEVVGSAGLLFDPHDVRAIAAAIESLATDDRLSSRLAAEGFERARRFSWAVCANSTIHAYRAALGSDVNA